MAGVDEASSQEALQEMQQAGAELLSGMQLLEAWQGTGSPASGAAALGGKVTAAAEPARLPAEQ